MKIRPDAVGELSANRSHPNHREYIFGVSANATILADIQPWKVGLIDRLSLRELLPNFDR